MTVQNNAFGDSLKDIRIRLGLNQTQMGERVGLTATSISRFETGKRPAPKSSIFYIKLSEIPGVTEGEVQALRALAARQILELYEASQWKEMSHPKKRTGVAYATVGDLELAIHITSSELSYYNLEKLAQWVMEDVEWLLQERQRRHSMILRVE